MRSTYSLDRYRTWRRRYKSQYRKVGRSWTWRRRRGGPTGTSWRCRVGCATIGRYIGRYTRQYRTYRVGR
eukprot:3505747-Rhodomonas_salina.1